jgi:predicted dehydrogenase
VEDVALAGYRFGASAIGTVHLDFIQQPPGHRMEITGTQGTLVWDQFEGGRARERKGLLWLPEGELPPDRDQMFRAEIDHFRSIARGEAEPACSLEDGIAALRMALAAAEIAQRIGLDPRDLEKQA